MVKVRSLYVSLTEYNFIFPHCPATPFVNKLAFYETREVKERPAKDSKN